MMKVILTATLFAALIASPAHALFESCKHRKDIDMSIDLEDGRSLTIEAGGGDLEVRGVEGATTGRIRGKVCVSKERWLEETRVEVEEGEHAEIRTIYPEDREGITLFGGRYAYIDLELELPASIALTIRDSSGDIEVADMGAVVIRDSSGDIDVDHVAGPVEIEDSSGDMKISHVDKDLIIIEDGSGDIHARDIGGFVHVRRDSSGDMTLTDVQGDVTVDVDSSGDISVFRVGGNFSVHRDGSGDIATADVAGDIDIPGHGHH